MGTAAVLPGCASSSSLGSSLEVSDTDSSTTMGGNIRLRAMVVNDSSDSASGTLYGEIDVQGGDTYTKTRGVTISPNRSNSYDLKFDIRLSESISGARYEYTAWVEE